MQKNVESTHHTHIQKLGSSFRGVQAGVREGHGGRGHSPEPGAREQREEIYELT